MDENEIAFQVIGAAIEVHKYLGPGLLESAYMQCLKKELALRGLTYESEVPVPVNYKGEALLDAYRLDLLVEEKLIVELKSVASVADLHRAQLLTYLRLCRKRLGLLINFNNVYLKKGISRVVHQL